MKRFAWILIAALAVGCSNNKLHDLFFRNGIEYFVSCGQLNDYVATQTKSQADYASSHPAPTNAASVGASPDSGQTNVQEADVDEADTVKVGDHHLYVVTGSNVAVLNRANLALIGSLTLERTDNKLYADGDRLVVISPSKLQFFTSAPGALPVLYSTKTFSGLITASRYLAGRVVIVVHDYAMADAPISNETQCRGIARPFVEDYDLTLTRVISLDTASPDDAREVGALGGGDVIYMTSRNLYLVKRSIYWEGYGDWDKSLVTKIDLSGANLTLTASGSVPGHVKDQWAMKEYSGALAVTTTTSTANSLSVLVQNGASLDVKASIAGFGARENVRAVRYVDNYAYVVTFRSTDPLFVFDMTNPVAPKLLGELVIPGFSTYLHPVGAGRLAGIGVDGSLTQLSLFDTSVPTTPRRIDNQALGSGVSTAALFDHHAFYFDSATAMLGLPTNVGAILYRYTGNAFTESYRISHRRWFPAACHYAVGDVSRLLRVDGKLVSVSEWGAIQHPIDNPGSEIVATQFSTSNTCSGYYPWE